MAATPSTMLPLGTAAPPFALPDVVSGATISLETFAEGKEYQGTDLGIVAVSPNDATAYPEDAPDSLKAMAAAESFTFPLCYDETQAVAKAYTAACTPDFFLFDQQRKLVYRGQLDASRPGNQIPVTGKDLGAAIEAVLAHQPINPVQKPSLGCNIKWKKGNEPAYFLRQ
jgi:hypothetical protein